MAENQEQPSFLQKFNLPVSTLWNNHKWFLIGFGAILLIIKFQDVIMDVLVSSGKKAVSDASKKDEQLSRDEDQAKRSADAALKEVDDLAKNKPKVDEDWNKK